MSRSSLSVQADIILALILRETRTRGGPLAILVDPIGQILVFTIVFMFLRRLLPVDVPIWSFVAAGVLVWLGFIVSARRTLKAVESNQALLMHRPITPLDAMLARVALEFVIWAGLALCLVVILYFAGVTSSLSIDYAFPFLLASALGGGLALLVASGARLFPPVARVLDIGGRILFFVSCVFYTPAMLPQEAASLILLNPIAHLVDGSRALLFDGYPSQGVDLTYPLLVALPLVALGLLSERATRHREKL